MTKYLVPLRTREDIRTDNTIDPETREIVLRIHDAWTRTIESMVETGRLLNEAKQTVGHGNFGKWMRKFCPFRPRTGEMLMRIAAHEILAKSANFAFLPPRISTLYDLSALEPNVVQDGINDGIINADMKRTDVAQVFGSDSSMKHAGKYLAYLARMSEKHPAERIIREVLEVDEHGHLLLKMLPKDAPEAGHTIRLLARYLDEMADAVNKQMDERFAHGEDLHVKDNLRPGEKQKKGRKRERVKVREDRKKKTPTE